jgi:cytohesin
MKHILLTTIAAVLVVGCGPSAPDISIHVAAMSGNIEAVKQHIAAGTDVNAKDVFERTPLHIAALYGDKEIAELLIDKGADVNAKEDKYGRIPLHEAAGVLHGREGHKEVVELLIANGADVNAKNMGGETALDEAECCGDKKETIDLLRKHGGKTGDELKAEQK